MRPGRYIIPVLSVMLLLHGTLCRGQFLDSASGLLHAPSADMSPSGTFMVTVNFMNYHATPPAWNYHTIGYGLNLVLFPRVELGYAMTLIDGRKRPNPSEREKILINQDRHFYAKFQLLKEGEFGLSWIPSLAIGVSDPTTSDPNKRLDIDLLDFDVSSGNGFFNRYFAVATKHFPSLFGNFGAHLGYQYNLRRDTHYNGPCAALDWEPVWLRKEGIVSAKLIVEYDARTFNVGCIASLWQDHFDIMVDLQSLRWFSAGVRFKMVLQ